MTIKFKLESRTTLPETMTTRPCWAGIWLPAAEGPAVVALRDGQVWDVTKTFPTVRDVCEEADPAAALAAAQGALCGTIEEILQNTPPAQRDVSAPWFIAPIDLQAIKAAGVTFAISMLERVIEERARGNPDAAASIRAEITAIVGDELHKLKPGSPEAQS